MTNNDEKDTNTQEQERDKRASVDKLGELHGVLAEQLMRRISSGQATASDFAVVAKFLKDNNITASVQDNPALAELQNQLNKRRARAVAQVVPIRPVVTPEEVDDAVATFKAG